MDSIIMDSIVDLGQAQDTIPTLAAWHHQEWAQYNPGQSLADRIELMQSFRTTDFIPSMFVYMRNGHPLGSAAIVDHDMTVHQQYSPWLASVYVAPRFRRQGVGRALIEFVMAEAKRNDLPDMYLFTPDQQSWYESLGWQKCFDEQYHLETVSVMRVML